MVGFLHHLGLLQFEIGKKNKKAESYSIENGDAEEFLPNIVDFVKVIIRCNKFEEHTHDA